MPVPRAPPHPEWMRVAYPAVWTHSSRLRELFPVIEASVNANPPKVWARLIFYCQWQGQFNPPSGVWRASSRGSTRGINPGTCPGRPGDAAEHVCEQKKCKMLKFFEAFHVLARSTGSNRSANRQSQVRERIIRAFRKFNRRII